MKTFWNDAGLTMAEAIELTVDSLNAYGPASDHWAVAWSGGKDSTATLTLLLHLIDAGRVQRPKRLTVLYADTRQELPPLHAAALAMIERLRVRDVEVETVCAPLDRRFLVYILGRGVPPPNNTTLRWCTRQIKVDPMVDALERLSAGAEGTILTITGIRQGESAKRDERIAMSCSRDGGECGQGWYQEVLPTAAGIRGRIATLAPLLHWRVCHVWDWLGLYCPHPDYGGFAEAATVADAYGGDEAVEIDARTGCIGCPLASRERALDTILAHPDWAWLGPLKELKPLYRELRRPANRLRKAKAEYLKDGRMAANPQRMGPLTFEARAMALERILDVQRRCNDDPRRCGRPPVDILNAEEVARIRELIALRTWPNGWDGSEPLATEPLDIVYRDGTVQPLLV